MAKTNLAPLLLLGGGAALLALLMNKSSSSSSAPATTPAKSALPVGTGVPGMTAEQSARYTQGQIAAANAAAKQIAQKTPGLDYLNWFKSQHSGMTPEQFNASQAAAMARAAEVSSAAGSNAYRAYADYKAQQDEAARQEQAQKADQQQQQARDQESGSVPEYVPDFPVNAPANGAFVYKNSKGQCKTLLWTGDPEDPEITTVPTWLRGIEFGQLLPVDLINQLCSTLKPGQWARSATIRG